MDMDCVNRKRKKSDSFEDSLDVGIIFDRDLDKQFNKLPQLCQRGQMVHSLIEAYGITGYLKKLKFTPATEDDLKYFHSSDFVEYIRRINNLYTPEDTVDLDYGLGYDCPPLDGIYDYCSSVAGSTLSAARSLMNCEVDVAINWSGGWHHAHRDEVCGFCYVNDIVLAILEMKHFYDRILYIDLDIHHGDGVERAFKFSRNIMTVSFHKYEPGFFPGTGGLVSNRSSGRSRVNVPLKAGITDSCYYGVFVRVLDAVLDCFSPCALVIQCGADGLSGDPLGGFSLSQESYSKCLRDLLKLGVPTLILGGGGYNKENTARLWTQLTALTVNLTLDDDLPDHEFLMNYGPGYELSITPSLRKNENDPEYINQVISFIESSLLEESARH